MRFGSRKPTKFESGPNMTPLVDVVMVILIFLMLVGSFATDQLFLQQKSGLLESASSAPPNPDQVPDEPIIVRVNKTVDGGFVVRADDISAISGDILFPQMKQRFDTLISIGKTADRITVVIQPDGAIGYGQLIEVYEAILKAGFEKVSFTTAK